MTSKMPTADEVLALVSAASSSEPTMQQLLMQVQQAQLLQAAQHHADDANSLGLPHGDAASADAAMELMTAVGVDAASMAASMQAAVAAANAAATVAAASAQATRPPTTSAGESTPTPTPTMVDATAGANTTIRRKSIPLSMKKQAIEWILGPGKGVPSRAEKHFSALNWDVSASSFRKWWKNRDKIMNDSSTKKRISGGGRKPYLEEGEERLLVIVIQERAKKDRVTRKWIAKTAQHMFQRTNANFKASENWVTKFIRRNGLTLKRSYVTYDHGENTQPGLAGGAAAAQAIGSIDVHEDDDDDMDDDDEPETEQTSGIDGRETTDAYVV